MSRSTLLILIIIAVITVILLAVDFFVTRSTTKRIEMRDPEGKKKKRALLIGCIIGVVIFGSGLATDIVLALRPPCGPLLQTASIESPVCIKDAVTIDGSTALQPLVQMVATAYTSACPQSQFIIRGTTSDEGLRYVEDHTNGVVVGNSDYVAQGYSDLTDHVVVVAIYCVIVNNSVDVTSLTTDNLKDIYNGRITTWKKFTPSDTPITVYGRPKGSGTRQTFENFVLGGPQEAPNTQTIDTTDNLIKAVAQKPGAIGYAALYDVKHYNDTHATSANIIDIGNVPAGTTATKDGSYAFWSYEHMYTKEVNAPPLALHLIDYMNSTNGRAIAQAHSFVGIADMQNAQGSVRCLS